MQYLLCTIGFAGKTAQEFFALLEEAGVERLIDIRQNRVASFPVMPSIPTSPISFTKLPASTMFMSRFSRP
jgi:hypothetical protein